MIVAGKNKALVQRLKGALKVDKDGVRMRGSNKLVTVEVARDPKAPPENPYFVGPVHLRRLMDLASVAISKPGGGSTSELAYTGLPSVLDASAGAMHWEEFTIRRFEEAKRAIPLRSARRDEVEAALRQAMSLGRDNSLAKGPDGMVLDTGARIRRQARRICGAAFEARETL